jgi:predicted ATPase
LVLMRNSVNGAMKAPNVQVVPFTLTRIHVKDFGPIQEADIHLGKVTVLMGPDNTGKTYTAVLMPVLEQLTRKWRFVQALMKPPKYALEGFELNLNTDIAALLPKA